MSDADDIGTLDPEFLNSASVSIQIFLAFSHHISAPSAVSL